MNRTLVLLLCAVIAIVPVNAQGFTLQMAPGYTRAGKFGIDLQTGYVIPGTVAIMSAGFETTVGSTGYVQFQTMAGLSLNLEQFNLTIIPKAGIGFTEVSEQSKQLNSKTFVAGLQIDRWIDPHSSVYAKMLVANSYAAVFVGLKFNFRGRYP